MKAKTAYKTTRGPLPLQTSQTLTLMTMRGLTPLKLLQSAFFLLLTLTLTLQAILSHSTISPKTLLFLSGHRAPLLATLWCTLLALLAYLSRRPRPVLLLDYSCYKPSPDRKIPFEVCEYFIRRSRRYTTTSEDFMRGIYHKSGLGEETYAPSFVFQSDYIPTHSSAVQEAEEGVFSAVDALLSKTNISATSIDVVVVTSGSFAPAPSIASLLFHRYPLRDTVKSYNLSGMGCSSGAGAIDLAARILRSSAREPQHQHALVVLNECISLNWYFGDDRPMLVTNCIFRVGTAAVLLTNDPAARRRGEARMELVHSLRTHHGADEAAYRAAFQEEDSEGNPGVSLRKDLIRVAGEGLRSHVRRLAPAVLPWTQIGVYLYGMAAGWVAGGDGKMPAVPDFTTAFEHLCIHTGGKAVIDAVGRLMRLPEAATEPARMCMHRFGNTSSSLVFYELAYFDAKNRVRAGDRVWMLAFGTGFKVTSLVWKALRDSCLDDDNPWADCVHRYPVKAW